MIKKKYLLPVAAIITSLLIASCGTSHSDTSETTEETTAYSSETPYEDVISDISYIDDGETYHMLDLYGTQSVTEPTPVVIEVHGGGFIGGTKELNADHSIFFARNGYVVVTPDYTKVQEVTGGTFKDAVQDLFAVYKWVEENAEKYNFDLNNIFLSGDSAGGYYTLLTNAIYNSVPLQLYFGVTPPSYDFTAYLTSCGAPNTAHLPESLSEGAFVATTIGGGQILDEELMSYMDLYSSVKPSVFKGVYLLTTPSDETGYESAVKFHEYLDENNVEHTYKSYEGTENELLHVFNIIKPDFAESIQANQDMVDYMNSLLK